MYYAGSQTALEILLGVCSLFLPPVTLPPSSLNKGEEWLDYSSTAICYSFSVAELKQLSDSWSLFKSIRPSQSGPGDPTDFTLWHICLLQWSLVRVSKYFQSCFWTQGRIALAHLLGTRHGHVTCLGQCKVCRRGVCLFQVKVLKRLCVICFISPAIYYGK